MSAHPPLQIGVIGAGFISQIAHLHAFSLMDGVRIAALADPHDALRETVADRFGIGSRRSDYRALLDDTALDAVVVCMPRRAQARIVADALAAKPAVLSEKPMAMTVAEASDLVDIASSKDRIWAIGYMKRHDPGVRRFRDMLHATRAEGRLGGIVDVAMRDFCLTYSALPPAHVRRAGPRPVRYAEGPAAPDFVRSEQLVDYEYTVNVASHDLNLLRFLFPESLEARSLRVRARGVQRIVLDAGGFCVALTMGPADVGHWDQRLDVTFERGRLSLVLPSPLARQDVAHMIIAEGGREEIVRVPPAERIWAFDAQARSFLACVRGDRSPPTGGLDGLADLRLIERLWNIVDWQQ